MTTATLSKQDLNGIDFDALENAQVKPDNKKQVIIDYINANGIPNGIPSMPLFQPNGTLCHDSFESYLSNESFYSTGAFAKLANGTPLDFLYDTTDGLKAELDKYKDKSSFEIGTFVHEAILEPGKWDNVVIAPSDGMGSTEGCEALISFWSQHLTEEQYKLVEGDAFGKIDAKRAWIKSAKTLSSVKCVDFKDSLIVQRIHERWKAYQGGLWYNILQSAVKEASMYTEDYRGLPMRIRPDGLLFENQIGVNAIVSVKTTAETSIRGLGYQFNKFNYPAKEAAYQKIASHITGLDFSTTIMIVLSTAEPFHCGVFILNDNEMEFATERFHGAIEVAKVCRSTGEYPGWEGVEEMGVIDLNLY